MKNRIDYRIPLSIILYVISIFGVYLDKDYKFNKIWLAIWLISLLIIPITSIRIHKPKPAYFNDYIGIIIFLVIVISRFIFINIYPYSSVGDELRDGGYVVKELMNGTTKNIFAYGPYNGFGLVATILVMPFHLLFANDTLAFKIPAAIISCVDLFLIYYFLKKYFNKLIAFLTTLVITSLPVHIYYGRTEFVVMTSSLFSTLIIILLIGYLKEKSTSKLIILGLVLGFSLNFQPALYSIVIIALTTIVVDHLFIQKKSIRLGVQKLILIMMMLIIGFGPTVLSTNQGGMFQSDKFNSFDKYSLLESLQRSFGIYFVTPTSSHFYLQAPLLTVFYAIFFIVGLLVLFKNRNALKHITLYGLLIIPIVNSAITNWINADHRLMVVVIFLAITLAYGIERILKTTESVDLIRISIISSLVLIPLLNIYLFFQNDYASYSMFWDTNRKTYLNFMNANMAGTINKSDSSEFCIRGSAEELAPNVVGHIKENYRYVLKKKVNLQFAFDNSIPTRTLVISKTCTEPIDLSKSVEYCRKYIKFECPFDKKPFTIIEQ
jgi:4-amino-4-deoxy-L-arabinose transferase-like glycosyltransferase